VSNCIYPTAPPSSYSEWKVEECKKKSQGPASPLRSAKLPVGCGYNRTEQVAGFCPASVKRQQGKKAVIPTKRQRAEESPYMTGSR